MTKEPGAPRRQNAQPDAGLTLEAAQASDAKLNAEIETALKQPGDPELVNAEPETIEPIPEWQVGGRPAPAPIAQDVGDVVQPDEASPPDPAPRAGFSAPDAFIGLPVLYMSLNGSRDVNGQREFAAVITATSKRGVTVQVFPPFHNAYPDGPDVPHVSQASEGAGRAWRHLDGT